ncbi:hypothetical protein FHW68_001550 [Pseudomonas sp. Tn43]|nr:hypothetical protein [Pseudomonas sp. Tn43]
MATPFGSLTGTAKQWVNVSATLSMEAITIQNETEPHL